MSGPSYHGPIEGRNVLAGNSFNISEGSTLNANFASAPSSSPPRPFSNVPFQQDPDFVDRPSITAWLDERLSRPGNRAALVGLGGIGKSQLAIHHAHRVRRSTPDTFVFWVYANTSERFEEAYRAIAERLQLPGRHVPEVSILRLVYEWLSNEENGQWLMILDNADDVHVFYPRHGTSRGTSSSTQALAVYLPQSSNGTILVTTRSADAAERLTGSSRNTLSIPTMDEAPALQLLQNKLGEKHDPSVALDLLHVLEYLPLAITQAAAYITRQVSHTSPAKYLEDFRRGLSRQNARLLRKEMGDMRRDPSASNSVITTWEMTFNVIRQEHESAADLLGFMSCFNPQGIPIWVLQSYRRHKKRHDATEPPGGVKSQEVDIEDELEDDLETLRGYSLVSTTVDDSMVEMHALVQFCMRVWFSNDDFSRTKRIFLQVISREYPFGDYENRTICRVLDPHIGLVVEEEPEDEEDAESLANLLTNAGAYRKEIGLYGEAETMSRKALHIYKKVRGWEDTVTFLSFLNLAVVFRNQGKYEEAEKMFRWVADGFEKRNGIDNPLSLQSILGLSAVLLDQEKYQESEMILRKVLPRQEKVMGREHPETLTYTAILGVALYEQGKYSEAEALLREVMSRAEIVLGRDHPSTLSISRYLGVVLLNQQKFQEAEMLTGQALDMLERLLGRDHPVTLLCAHSLGVVFRHQRRLEESHEMFDRAWNGFAAVLGPSHAHTLACGQDLAKVKRQLEGQPGNARGAMGL